MRHFNRTTLPILLLCSAVSVSQAQAPAAPSATDVYHVLFVKAAPGQAAAVAKELQELDPKDPMASHYLLLRHQEGDDWDYCIIQHLGAKATVDVASARPNPPPTMAWHTDTFVSGPSWPEFTRALLPQASDGKAPGSIYIVAVHRAAPGHRTQLIDLLKQGTPGAKVPISSVMLTHLEGGSWQVLNIDRYNSWQDLGTDRAAGMSTTEEGWLEFRQHSAYHVDTIADRVMPK